MIRAWICGFAVVLTACSASDDAGPAIDAGTVCEVELIVLGAGQDAGAPQIGNSRDAGWNDPSLRLLPVSLGLIDRRADTRYLFEATPHITEQVRAFDVATAQTEPGLHLDGVFLTHAHIGHYAGLMFFGREAAGASGVPVYAMPRMAGFLRENAPWSQLVTLNNISIQEQADRQSVQLSELVSVTPYRVPHRDEFSETVGYVIEGPEASALFLPDIDSWEEWQSVFGVRIADMVAQIDYAFVDATFFDDNELPGRDMSEIPHPRVSETMALFAEADAQTRAKVHFIHYNHTNPIRDPRSDETAQILDAGFRIARAGDRVCLGELS